MKNLYISAASISNDESPKPEYLQCQAILPSASLEMFNISTCNMAKHTSDQINIRAMIEMHVDVDAMLP